MTGATPQEKAYLAPFVAFLAILALGSLVAHLGEGFAFWMVREPRYWVYPLQTAICAILLARAWSWYEMGRPRQPMLALAVGAIAFAFWIAPQQWLGFPARRDGFEPNFFGLTGVPYALNLSLRFVRLVIIVPLVEEIFWRGFLLRFLIRDDFARLPIGTFSGASFFLVTAGFTLEHAPADWLAAALTGLLYNFVAWRTRSLSACVLAHAVTNALLGGYVLRTGQWGFW